MMLRFFIFTIIISVFIPKAFAQEEELTISDFTLGRYLHGEPLNTSNLDQYVVILHLWSAKQSDSSSQIPTLKRFYNRYRSKGLVIIGAHTQLSIKATTGEVWKLVERSRNPYMTVLGARPPKSIKIAKLPHVFVFNVGGKLIHNGDLARGLKKATALVRLYPRSIVGDRKIKYLRSEQRRILQLKKLGGIYKKLAKHTRGKKQEEAEYLMERLDDYASLQKGEVEAFKELEPDLYLKKAKQYVNFWRGHESAKTFDEEINELSRSKEFSQERAAAKIYDQLERYMYEIKPVKDLGIDLSNPKVRKKNRKVLGKIVKLCRRLTSRYSETNFASKAENIMESLGLKK